MKHIIFDAQTGETTFIEVQDEEMPIEPGEPSQSLEDRVNALESTTAEVVETLNDKGLIP